MLVRTILSLLNIERNSINYSTQLAKPVSDECEQLKQIVQKTKVSCSDILPNKTTVNFIAFTSLATINIYTHIQRYAPYRTMFGRQICGDLMSVSLYPC